MPVIRASASSEPPTAAPTSIATPVMTQITE
jgi:hypothetical protein